LEINKIPIDSESYRQMPSGLIVPNALAVQRPKGVDLFAGAGGMSLGFILAGFEVVAAVDNQTDATITYTVNLGTYPCEFHFLDEGGKDKLDKAVEKLIVKKNGVLSIPVTGSGWISNYPEQVGVGHFFFGDVCKLSGKQILDAVGLEKGELDCVFGGPPCQGFSTSGKRNVMDPRNSLVFEFARLVIEMMPKTMVMENVPGILNMVTPDGLPVVDTLCFILEDGGFGNFNALKRSLINNYNAGAAIRSNVKKRKSRKKKEKKIERQMGLF